MFDRLTSVKFLLAIAVSVGLLAALSCAADEPAAEPVAAPGLSSADVQSAVSAAISALPQPAAAPAGPSAAEIRSLVENAVASNVPAATDPNVIKRMIDTAVSGVQPGITRAQLEASIASQAGSQMTAADVKTVVDSAIRALPAPKVDPESIRPLIESAVMNAVPEGVSAEEIRTMVMAAVTASTANVPTRGELEESIRSSVAESARGALTAAQVQRIVDASVDTMVANLRTDLDTVRGSVEALAAIPTPSAMGARVGFLRTVLQPYVTNFRSFQDDPNKPVIADQTLYTVENGVVDMVDCHDRTAQYTGGWFCIAPIKKMEDGGLGEGFAISYDVDSAGVTYILNLHPDAVYQNGKPITAQSVKKGWEWVAMPENRRGAQLGIAGVLQQIRGFDAVISGDALQATGLAALDDHSLQLILKFFDPLWPLKMSEIRLGAFDTDFVDENPDTWMLNQTNGSGPYRTEFNPDTGEANWYAADNWWGDEPIIKHIQMLGSSDLQSQYILFENGEADIIQASLPYQPQIHSPDHKFFNTLYHHFVGGFWQFIFRNKPPFEDVKVREAFIRSIQITETVKAVETDAAEVAAGIIVRGVRCNDPSIQGVRGFDPARAKELLAESTYGSAANLPASLIEVARPNFIREFEIYQQQWKDNLGVTVGLTRLQPGMDRSPDANMSRSSVGTGYNDPARIIRNMGHSTGYYQTVSGFADPELDAMIELAETYDLADPARCAAYRAAEDRIINNFWHVPLFLFVGSQAAREWVNDYNVIEFSYPWMSISPRTGARSGDN